MTVRLGTRVPDTTVNLGAAILSGGGSPPAPAATMPSTALYLPGTSGNYVSTPDAASLDITGDICLVAHVALDDWTPSGYQSFVSKWQSGSSTQSFLFRMTDTAASSRLQLITYNVGTLNCISNSTASPTISDGEALWVAVTWDADNGASGNDAKFWTSTDGSSWSQLGSTVTVSTARAIQATTTPLLVGATDDGLSNQLAGTIYYAAVYSGIGANTAPGQGTLVYEADFSHPWVGNRYTDSTGKVSTINGSAWAWEVV